jgi:Kef-type K+ transport system membrane component KefB
VIEVSFTGLAAVAAVAFLAPVVLGLAPALRLPAVVLEIVLGIVIGPSGFGWVEIDPAISVLALIGLAFLLLIAGLEVEWDMLRGRVLRITAIGFVVSFVLASVAGLVLDAAGLVGSPLLIAVALSASALGVIVPILKDAGEIDTMFGQVVIAGASIAEVATIVLLSFFFSGESGGIGVKVVLLGGFVLLVLAVGLVVVRAEHSRRISETLGRLQDTTAQVRIRAAFLLLTVLVVLAERFGLEAILGAFVAGAIIKLVDRDVMRTHPEFRQKLEAVGFGVFIPVFFVASGLRFNLDALFASGATIARVPLFLVALYVARGLPALLYRRLVGSGPTLVAASLLQATSVSFLVVVSQIGLELGLLSEGSAAALVAAGLISVIVFPLAALTILRRESRPAPVVKHEPSAA